LSAGVRIDHVQDMSVVLAVEHLSDREAVQR
jgi:hypothetical protein